MVSEGASRSQWLEQEAPDLVNIWNDPHNNFVPDSLTKNVIGVIEQVRSRVSTQACLQRELHMLLGNGLG